MSSVHYRKELNFSNETLETAKKELEKVLGPMKQADIQASLKGVNLGDSYDEESYRAFLEAMEDDMNTPNAYAVIFETIKLLNQDLRVKEIDFSMVEKHRNAVEKMLNILGVTVDKVVLSDEDKELFNKWNAAKAEKNFEEADVYRAKLIEKGYLA